jgi:hypothetical protein
MQSTQLAVVATYRLQSREPTVGTLKLSVTKREHGGTTDET